MSETRWREVEQAMAHLLELPPGEYQAYLERSTLSPEVRDRVEQLLRALQNSEGFLERPALARDVSDRLLGQRLGPWRLIAVVASGGMGTVYRAERSDQEFTQQAALKVIASGHMSRSMERRFREEREILARLEHPNVARLIDGGVAPDGSPYLVMEYVEGAPVDAWCHDRGLDRRQRLRLFCQVCDAVQFAHERLVVHCDLKPANILVTANGAPKLLDFGIARLLSRELEGTATLLHPMTPDYASPEQVRGLIPGVGSDVYSLGIVLHELLTGRRPYRLTGETLEVVLATVCHQEIDKPGTGSADLDAILLKALRKDPEQRYRSVEQFAADVQRYLDGRPVAAVAGSWLYRARKFVRRRAIPLAAAAAVTIALAAGGVSTWLESRRTERRFNELRGLAHSLLFDVYDSISATPDSLAPRRLVAGRARQYLESLYRDAGNDPALGRDLAESYLRLGDVLGSPYTANLGDTAGAFQSYERALELLEREAARRPKDIALLDRLAEAHLKRARVLSRRGEAAAAVDGARKAIGILESLPPSADPEHFQKLTRMYAVLAEAQEAAAGQSIAGLQEALATSQRALDVIEAGGPRTDDSWRLSYAGTLSQIGYALWLLGDRTGDLSYHRKALEYHLKANAVLREVVAAHPERPYEREMADGILTIGLSRWKGWHDFAASMRDIEQARDTFQHLSARESYNVELKRDLANAWSARGFVLGQAGRRTAALAAERQALAIYEALSRTDPVSAENASMVARSRSRIAALLEGEK